MKKTIVYILTVLFTIIAQAAFYFYMKPHESNLVIAGLYILQLLLAVTPISYAYLTIFSKLILDDNE